MGEELYLYAQYPLLLCRLNLSKLSDTDLEVIHDFRNHRYPEGMGFMIVDSKPYLFGGEKIFPVSVGADEYEYQSTEEIFCFDTYLLDPTSREDPLVSVDSIPKLGGPKIRPIVVTIERKTYVLTGQPLLSSLYKLKGPHFEVFDHGKRTWERVNDPPVFDRESGKTIVTYFAWGHRLLLRTLGGLSIFDTRKLIWEDGWWFLDQLRKWPSAAPFPTGTAAEIEGGFYIALSIDNNELVAYEFDPDGVLKSYRVLDEISDVFSSEPELGLEYCTGFVTRIGGDGRMCLVLGGPTFGDSPGVRVAVFRVSAVTGGLSVDVECLKFFYLQDFDPIHYAIDSIMVIRYSQDSMSSVGSGYTENYDNSGEKTSLYPPIDDLISNVHISDNAGTVPASPSAPAANSVSSSPMNLHTQSAKYETEGNTYGNYKSSHSGKWDASHSVNHEKLACLGSYQSDQGEA